MLTRSLLEELGLTSFCKTSGGKGLHVVAPLSKHAGWDEVKEFSQAVRATHGEHAAQRTSARRWARRLASRKIFVDYLRNNRGSSTCRVFGAGGPGPRRFGSACMGRGPQTTGGDQWNIAENPHERLDELKGDPWADYAKTRQRITAAMRKRLERRVGEGRLHTAGRGVSGLCSLC